MRELRGDIRQKEDVRCKGDYGNAADSKDMQWPGARKYPENDIFILLFPLSLSLSLPLLVSFFSFAFSLAKYPALSSVNYE
jgi:hypothetical protein